MTEPTIAAPETAAPSTEQPTAEEFKERFPGAEPAIPDAPPAPNGEGEGKPEIPTTRIHLCSDGKHRNDEQYEVYKKYEERLELKKAQFKKDPDQFIHIDDIMMGVIVGDKGKGCIFGRFTIEEMKAAAWTLQHRFSNNVSEMEYMMDMKMKKEQGLVGADGKPIAKNTKIIT